ncbi:OpgC domain-containing protein [Methylobacterium sp. M6A4_1b]
MPQRRTTIDAIRGLCLINIFVNHIQDGAIAAVSPSRLGFSDSADIFVLLSGISVALAGSQSSRRRVPDIVAHLWRRAVRIYAFDLVIILSTLGILAAILALRGVAGVHAEETGLLRDHGVPSVLSHAVSLRQTVGYSGVLRLYVALMLVAPLLLRLAGWRFWAPLPPALLVWLAAGHFDLVVNNSLTGMPFALTVLPWILVFSLGIAIGQGMVGGVALPRSRWLTGLALAYLASYLVLAVVLVRLWPPAADWAATRNDTFWFGASKTYQSPLRVLHVLALAYVVMALPRAPLIRLLHQVPYDHILTRLGRRSLPVFTAGAIGAVVASEALDLAAIPLGDAWLPLLLLEAGMIALFVGLALRIGGRAGRAPPSRPASPDGQAPARDLRISAQRGATAIA